MGQKTTLETIRKKLFYGSADYTKNQPDLFIPHKFRLLAPSQAGSFLDLVKESITEEEILLYVHLPFCFSECLFCNSFSYKADKGIQANYLNHLIQEIDIFAQAGVFDKKKVKCIYMGGGTPTSFSNNDIGRIIEKISSVIDFASPCNITMEAHPATLTHNRRIEGLAEIGINRISIGCQTFDQEILAHCNRENTVSQVREIVTQVQQVGIAINVDMMSGLPGQTLDGVKKDLLILEDILPDAVEYIRHEIVNPLMVEFYKKRPDLVVDDDTLFDMIYLTQEWMEKNDYEQNGRYSSPNHWEYRYHWLQEMPIIAFGSRARSYTKTICYDKHEELSSYSQIIKKGVAPVGRYILLTEKEQMYRSLFLNLQIKSGLDMNGFQTRFSSSPSTIFASLFEKLTYWGCVEQKDSSIRLTRLGAYFVEDVCDYIIDTALREDSTDLVRAPHSKGSTSVRLNSTYFK